MTVAAPWQLVPGGVALVVRLTPKGGRDAIDGIGQLSDGRSVLKARVRAAPVGGEANDALVHMIARAAGVPPRAVAFAGGVTARVKRLMISGDGPAIVAALVKLAGRA